MNNVTYAEIIEMRDLLDAALEAKIGRKPRLGFGFEVDRFIKDQCCFSGAYTLSMEIKYAVNGRPSTDPHEAFDFAMTEINLLDDAAAMKAKRLSDLKAQIADLEAVA